jgi:serine/threonine-protein kinase PknK
VFAAGQRLAGRYRLRAELGSGGSASAWRAHDELFDRDVALKLLGEPALELVLRGEFARLARLAHPSLVRVHDWATDRRSSGALHFFSADFIDGQTLDRFALAHGFARAKAALIDALDALGYLHRAGILHGDFKPANVLVDSCGRGVLIDLGCARPLGAPLGSLSGSPEYLAPELLRGGDSGPRADLYAVGVTLQTLGGIDRSAKRLADRLLRADPDRRPADVAELLEALGAPERAGRGW